MSSTSIPDGDLTKDEILVEPDDPCNSYEWSILFLLVLIIATILIVVECFSLFKRRGELLSGFDILITFFFICTVIQFGPMIVQILHAGHNTRNFTQTGCKLVHFTEYGIRHVILLIVLGLVLYAWLITKHNFNQEQIDKRIRNSLPWLILLCFAIEGIFGMPIAIYVDVLPNFPDHCVWSPTLKLSSAQIVSMEIMLRPVIPYMIPALLLPWPLILLRSTLTSVEGSKLKCQIQTIIIIGWAYICLNIPYSLTFLAHYISMMKGNLESEVMEALCNVQWFFFLFHQIFFALVPGLMLRYEMILENPQSGVLYLRQISEQSWNKIKALSTSREDRTDLV